MMKYDQVRPGFTYDTERIAQGDDTYAYHAEGEQGPAMEEVATQTMIRTTVTFQTQLKRHGKLTEVLRRMADEIDALPPTSRITYLSLDGGISHWDLVTKGYRHEDLDPFVEMED